MGLSVSYDIERIKHKLEECAEDEMAGEAAGVGLQREIQRRWHQTERC